MLIDILSFYISIINDIFTRILNGFEIMPGIGFGTFLLGCGILVAFISLIKFQYSNPTIVALKKHRQEKLDTGINAKHSIGNNSIGDYYPMHSKHSGRYR